jgi:CRISPR-associated protein Csh2
VRLFGAVTAEEGTTEGHYTGPVQFNWGHSLHPIELVDSSTITSSFSSGEGVGKDYRLYYSLIAFSGSINANIAKGTKMTPEDLKLLDEAMLKSIPFFRTRSKIGQYPRLYMRIEMKDKLSFLKDLRSMVGFVPKDHIGDDLHLIRKIDDYRLDMSKLVTYLNENKDLINEIHLWQDSELELTNFNNFENDVSKLTY